MIQCPACHGRIVEPLYSPGPQPLAALNLPKSQDAALRAPLYPMNFYVCCSCGHAFNSDFDYAKVPYEEDSNLMYNNGVGWVNHLDFIVDSLFESGIQGKTVIDIGAGDGGFLDLVNQRSLDNGVQTRCIAFEPGIESVTCETHGLEVQADYFIPQRDIPKFEPDFLLCRHVLEHLQSPRDFVAEIAYYANKNKSYPFFVAEVPCITKALNTHRLADFLYEHVSNFTQCSLRVMFEQAGWVTYGECLTYNDEVAIWVGRPETRVSTVESQAKEFREHTWNANTNIHLELQLFRQKGLSIAFWGGTGKGAAFLNAYHLKGDRVVDSDPHKVGRFVPGTGQEIEHADALLENPADIIVITTRWRAADIYAEIQEKGIKHRSFLTLNGPALQEYTEKDYVQETKKEEEEEDDDDDAEASSRGPDAHSQI